MDVHIITVISCSTSASVGYYTEAKMRGKHMRSSQEIREQIIILLKEKNKSVNKMLNDCGCNTNLLQDMKSGKMPSADKIVTIAQYLEVSTTHLMGMEKQSEDSLIISEIAINKELSELIKNFSKMGIKHRKQLMEYIKFLETIDE